MEADGKSLPEGTEFVTMMSSTTSFSLLSTMVANINHRYYSGYSGGVFLLAGLKEYAHSVHIHHSVAGRYVCLPGGCGIQSEYPDIVCTGALPLVRSGGRCHCGGGSGCSPNLMPDTKSPYLATKDAMGDVTMAIISCTCVFMAIVYSCNIYGRNFRCILYKFGITMATAAVFP